jgi:hypothetical protein
VYVWRDAVARHAPTGPALNGSATLRAWRALRADAKRDAAPEARPRSSQLGRRLGTRALVAGFPLAVGLLNRAGLGPLNSEVSARELRRAGLRAMGEVAQRLGLGEAYVVFGHTHRAGPLPGDDEREWRGLGAADHPAAPSGARLVNCGCWTYDTAFLSQRPGESPYWPGGCVVVDEQGAPRLLRLLATHSHEQLRPADKSASTETASRLPKRGNPGLAS